MARFNSSQDRKFSKAEYKYFDRFGGYLGKMEYEKYGLFHLTQAGLVAAQ